MKAFTVSVITAVLAAGVLAQKSVTPESRTSFEAPALIKPATEPPDQSKLCLSAISEENGASVTIQECESTSNEQHKWDFKDKALKIHGKCLHVTTGNDGKAEDGTKLILDTCDGSDNQKFTFETPGNKFLWAGKKCLDFTDAKPGSQAQAWDCPSLSYNSNQRWEAWLDHPDGTDGSSKPWEPKKAD